MTVHLQKASKKIFKKDMQGAIKEFKKLLRTKQNPDKKNDSSFYAKDYIDCVLWILAQAGYTNVGSVRYISNVFSLLVQRKEDPLKGPDIAKDLFRGFWTPEAGPMDGGASDAEMYFSYSIVDNLKLTVSKGGESANILYLGYNDDIAHNDWKRFADRCVSDRFEKLKHEKNQQYVKLIELTALAIFEIFSKAR